MTNLKTFAGFDVSKNTFDVCLLQDGKEQSYEVSYNTEGLSRLSDLLPSATHCVMEATGPYYMKLAFHLFKCGFVVSVINPLVIRRFCQMRLIRAKTDKADARMIALYGQTEQPEAWVPPADYIIKLQQLDAVLCQLQKQRTALLCQHEAFTATALLDKEMKQFFKSALSHLDKQLLTISNKMESIIEMYHKQMLNNLLSVPGIGKKTAIMLIVLSGGFTRFSNYKKLSAYVGLSPRIFQSGTSVKGKSRICKMGMSRIRAMLYVCAWSAKRYNKACKELYDRLVEKGKSKRLALIAVANKLIKQVFAIATNNQTYQPEYAKNICF